MRRIAMMVSFMALLAFQVAQAQETRVVSARSMQRSTDALGNLYAWESEAMQSTSDPTTTVPIQEEGKIVTGTGSAKDTSTINFGTGDIFWSVARYDMSGYLYSDMISSPPVSYGNITEASWCNLYYPGYSGPDTIQAFTSQEYQTWGMRHSISIGDVDSGCYQGIVLFEQDGLYGGIRPDNIDAEGTLHYTYWYETSGKSDFSGFKDPESQILYSRGTAYAWSDITTPLGTIEFMSNRHDGTGFFIHDNSVPEISFGNMVWPNPCDNPLYGGYNGPEKIQLFSSEYKVVFTSEETVFFADSMSDCYMGILPFRQGGNCGAINPIEFINADTLLYEWWVDMSGNCDFSQWENPDPTTTTSIEITTTTTVCDVTTSTIRPTTTVKPTTTTTEKVTTTIKPDTTTTVKPITTSTIKPTTTIEPTTTIQERTCVIEIIYGQESVEAQMCRYIRDTVLATTAEGREIIKMYYLYSPLLVTMIENDEEVEEMIKVEFEEMLNLIVK